MAYPQDPPIDEYFKIPGVSTWDDAFLYASSQGHLNNLKKCEKHIDKPNWGWAMRQASLYIRWHIITYIESKNIPGIWNWAMAGASQAGLLYLVKYCEEKGANNWNQCLRASAYGGHLKIIRYCELKGANDWNYALISGAYLRQTNTVDYCYHKLFST